MTHKRRRVYNKMITSGKILDRIDDLKLAALNMSANGRIVKTSPSAAKAYPSAKKGRGNK